VTSRQSTPGPGHCSNRKQLLISSRKGRQDSHARVQTVQAGRGPGGWTRRRRWNMASAPGRPRYDISYPISTKALISNEKIRYLYIPTLHRYRVRHQRFYVRHLYIPILPHDIVIDIDTKLRYRTNIECPKSVEFDISYPISNVLYDIVYDIVSISTCQRGSFWSVLNIVYDIVYDIDIDM
jgi:hypothetical protein